MQRKVVFTRKGIAERESSTRSAQVAGTQCLQTVTEQWWDVRSRGSSCCAL